MSGVLSDALRLEELEGWPGRGTPTSPTMECEGSRKVASPRSLSAGPGESLLRSKHPREPRVKLQNSEQLSRGHHDASARTHHSQQPLLGLLRARGLGQPHPFILWAQGLLPRASPSADIWELAGHAEHWARPDPRLRGCALTRS